MAILHKDNCSMFVYVCASPLLVLAHGLLNTVMMSSTLCGWQDSCIVVMSEPQGKWHIMHTDRRRRGNESLLLASSCLTQKCDKRPEHSANKQMCQIGVKGLFVIVCVGFRLTVLKACSHLVRYNRTT